MSYAQPGGKRQKVRDVRASENVDYFQGKKTLYTYLYLTIKFLFEIVF